MSTPFWICGIPKLVVGRVAKAERYVAHYRKAEEK